MKPHIANLFNSMSLIILGFWEYYSYLPEGTWQPASVTSFIPLSFGILLLITNAKIKQENKIVSHIAVLFTFIILLGLSFRLNTIIGDPDTTNGSIYRMVVMVVTSAFAMTIFIKSFIDARKKK